MKTKFLLSIILVVVFMSCCNTQKSQNNVVVDGYQKKYTNADFYKDGVLQADVAVAAYKDMLEYYGIPWSDNLEKNLWISDFELGDMENLGMAGIFWINDSVHSHFGHEIYLLPNQMIAEHKHVATRFPAKMESWKVNKGSAICFSTEGEETPNAPKLPESQKDYITCKNFCTQAIDEVLSLKKMETFHFTMAGEYGAVITEYGSYHDNGGLVFQNPNAIFTDIRTK